MDVSNVMPRTDLLYQVIGHLDQELRINRLKEVLVAYITVAKVIAHLDIRFHRSGKADQTIKDASFHGEKYGLQQ